MRVRRARPDEADEIARQYVGTEEGWIAGFGGVNTTHAKGVVTFGMAVMPEARGSRSRACVATTTAARTDRCARRS